MMFAKSSNRYSYAASDDSMAMAYHTCDGASPGYIYVSTDIGQTWIEQTTLGLKMWTDIWVYGEQRVIYDYCAQYK